MEKIRPTGASKNAKLRRVLGVHAVLVLRGRCRACRTGPSRRRAGGPDRARATSPGSSCIRAADLGRGRSGRQSRARPRRAPRRRSTHTFQGCMLEPDGARPAISRMCSISSRGTGLGRKARMLRRPVMASSTVIMAGVPAGTARPPSGRCCGGTMTRPSFAGSIDRATHLASARNRGDAHAIRSQRIRPDGRRGRHRLDGPRHHAGVGPGRHARHRLRREAGRRRRRPRTTSPRRWTAWSRRAACREADAEAARRPHRRRQGAWRRSARPTSSSRRSSSGSTPSRRCSPSSRRVAGPDTILASNTSSIPITAIASAVQAPRARRRHALLQSGAADAAGRDHPRPQDGAVGDGRHDGASAGA